MQKQNFHFFKFSLDKDILLSQKRKQHKHFVFFCSTNLYKLIKVFWKGFTVVGGQLPYLLASLDMDVLILQKLSYCGWEANFAQVYAWVCTQVSAYNQHVFIQTTCTVCVCVVGWVCLCVNAEADSHESRVKLVFTFKTYFRVHLLDVDEQRSDFY